MNEFEKALAKTYNPSKITNNKGFIAEIIRLSTNNENLRSVLDYVQDYKLRTENDLRAEEKRLIELSNNLQDWERTLCRKEAKVEQYTEDIEALKQCETPEARDKIRLVTVLKENADIKTGYDRNEFIKALGKILGGETAEKEQNND